VGEAYRFGFEFFSPDDQRSVSDARWSLAGLDPATLVRTGTLYASDGEKIPYRIWRAETPRALVLLLHGAMDYSGAFDEIGPLFAGRGFTAMAIDQRGFGATTSRGKWRGKNRMIRDAVEAVLLLRRREGDGPVFIVGESMGAALAVHVASRAPDLGLAGIVLAAPGAVSGTWRRMLGTLLTRVLHFFAPSSGIVIERMSAWDFTPAAAIRLLSDPMVLRRIKPGMLFGLFKLSRSAVDEAEHVRVPALTMVGGREDLLREDCIKRLHHNLAGEKEWARFKRGPHLLLHWKRSDRVLGKIFSWIESRLTAGTLTYKIG
jgi:alpha-beta hydrolase superfamily lysophospholipase